MSRLLFWIALAVLVVFAIRAKLRELTSKSTPATGQGRAAAPGPAAAPGQPQSERMTNCAHCGVYFPSSEAVTADGRDYCCPAHVRQPPHK